MAADATNLVHDSVQLIGSMHTKLKGHLRRPFGSTVMCLLQHNTGIHAAACSSLYDKKACQVRLSNTANQTCL